MPARPAPSARRALAAALLALSLPGCRDAATGPVLAPAARSAPTRLGPEHLSASLLECPADVAQRADAWIGPEGGTLSAPGATLAVPAGAVAEPTHFEIVVPASPTVKVDVHAAGHEHFRFLTPATLTLGFSRCAPSAPAATLQGAYVDLATDAVLEYMGGTVDEEGRRVTFTTPHLSGYAIVY